MQKSISYGQLRVLMAGLRSKILNTDCVVDYDNMSIKFDENITVEDVLEYFYSLIASYKLEGDIGIVEGQNAVEYMAAYGVFTGNEGEQSIDDICSVEQACVIATRLVTYLYDALDAASKGFLWEISSGDNKVYLLGSIHIANYDVYPFSNKMLKAFLDADVLGVEANLLDVSVDVNALSMQYGMYNDGSTLKDHVSEETYQMTVQMAASLLGMNEEMISMFKPWLLFNTFTALLAASSTTIEDAALAQGLGIDMKFLVDAYVGGKPIMELEGAEYQLGMFDSFSDELAELLLISTLESLTGLMDGQENADSDLIGLMLEYWHEGDVDSFMEVLAPILAESDLPVLNEEDKKAIELLEEYNDKLFTQRDKGMAEKIDSLLQAEGSTTYFIVVGSGHYISDYSVIDILEEKGYEINQIK
jgi:uncharacterized protein YbaP (TraB family)